MLRVILVGAGNRAKLYGGYQDRAPERLKVVGVCDPDPVRRRIAADRFGIPEDAHWSTVDDLPPAGEVAEAVFNATLDNIHVATTKELLAKGYHVLLEKPIGTSAREMFELEEAATSAGRHVQVCHVLRFAPFYQRIKELVLGGAIGRVLNIQMAENVSYDHYAVSFLRGKFRNSREYGSAMLLAKSCHDLDLMAWLMSGNPPSRVTSTGGKLFFHEDQAPEGSGERCMVDCRIEASCPYSAKRHYLDNDWWGYYAWQPIDHLGPNPTMEQKVESLRTDNPYGRCVWRTDSDMVDHQVVTVEFGDGATGSLSMVANSALPSRTIHIIGSHGEIEGELHSSRFTLRRIPGSGSEFAEVEEISVADGGDMHGGGDLRLVEDFCSVLAGEEPSISTTALSDSINGHLVGFAAEVGREEGRWVGIDEMRELAARSRAASR